MKIYKLMSDTVVAIIDADGQSRMSCLTEHPAYLAWLSLGNTPEPAFTPAEILANTKRETNALIQSQLAAADLKIIRALAENDVVRINAHKSAQATLRAGLIA